MNCAKRILAIKSKSIENARALGLITAPTLLEGDSVVIGGIERVEELFERRITFHREKYFVIAAEEKASMIDEC